MFDLIINCYGQYSAVIITRQSERVKSQCDLAITRTRPPNIVADACKLCAITYRYGTPAARADRRPPAIKRAPAGCSCIRSQARHVTCQSRRVSVNSQLASGYDRSVPGRLFFCTFDDIRISATYIAENTKQCTA